MKLGFELLREGSKINQHISRFEQSSSPGYKCIPLKDYLVVDFCMTEEGKTRPFDTNPCYVRVSLVLDFKVGVVSYWEDNEILKRDITFK